MPGRRATIVAVTALVTGAWGVSAAAPSQAANNDQTQSVAKSWTSYSPALGVCARYNLSATMKFRSTYSPAQTTYPTKPAGYMVSNARLYNPVLSVKTYSYSSSGGCSTTAKSVSKITFTQHWGGHACSFNPSVSVSVPWGVGVSFWPSCGTKNQARSTSSFGSGTSFTQNNYNNGSPVATWSGSLAFRTTTKPPNPCLSVFVDSKITRGTSDDAYGGSEVSSKSVCLAAVYK